jgi:hypothetical protein
MIYSGQQKNRNKTEIWERFWNIERKTQINTLNLMSELCFNMPDNQLGKRITTKSKADKIVFETEDKDWVIIDVPELHEYVKKQSLKVVQFEDLLCYNRHKYAIKKDTFTSRF